MSITLSEEALRAAETQAAAGGHRSVNDYLEAMIRADRELDTILDAIFDEQVDTSPEAVEAERAEVVAALKRSDEDVAAGRYRLMVDAIRDIARANGIALDEAG